MARSPKTGGKRSAAKTRQARSTKARNSAKTKRPVQPATRLKPSTASDKELKEAREQQAATANILKVIASSPSDVQPVFEAIAASANRLIGGYSTTVYRFIDGIVHLKAFTPISPEADEVLRSTFPMPVANLPQQKVLLGETDQIPDTEAGEEFQVRLGRARGFRSIMFTPLMYQGVAIGMIAITRRAPGRFADHHARLLQTFADQAVIAIENARLFDETREALERQMATADILKVIASSPSDTQPVFEAIVQSGLKLFPSSAVMVVLANDGVVSPAAIAEADPRLAEMLRRAFPVPLTRDYIHAISILDKRMVEIPDAEIETDEYPVARRQFLSSGHRAITIMPMMREDQSIGALSVVRPLPGPLSERQLELLKTFADQAVIAIENTRLLRELRKRTDDLSESLQQQTATADVLKVIASSPSDVQPVFDAIVNSGASLFEPATVSITTLRDGQLHWGALAAPSTGTDLESTKAIYPVPLDPRYSPSARAILERHIIEIPDIAAPDTPDLTRKIAAVGGFKSATFVPLVKDDQGIGTIILSHPQAGFRLSAKQLALVQTFADQAVIAIENARMFNETQEALERQTATADILKVIASSPDDVQPVFDAIAASANRIVDGRATAVYSLVHDMLHLMAFTSTSPEADAALRAMFPRPLTSFRWGEAILGREVYQVPDMHDPSIPPEGRDLADRRGYRALMLVPLVSEQKVIGVISVTRATPGKFAVHHTQLLQTFADQAVIAISNVGLFREVQERTRDLSRSLDELRTAQDRLVQTEKLASLGQLTAGIAHEIKNPLNFVNNFAALSAELTGELSDVLRQEALTEKGRDELNELTGLLQDNLTKVVQHGKRADAIVKNMLLHSREGSGERRSAEINRLVEESLNLAYHGARAEKVGFNITLRHDLDPGAGAVDLYPQEITRALLNLISNGFYAATKRKAEVPDGDFEPFLSAATRNLGSMVEIRIRDNGTGIPPEVLEKIFNPFFTTKPTGEGTGLGLSMTHDIIVKQHGGRINVETEPGAFTEFIITLPRKAPAA